MIVHGDVEDELHRVWNLISELSEQLDENRIVTVELHAQADALKTAAMHSGTGYPLRRFNMDLSKEAFEEELEKLNAQFSIENQSLSNDNKQLSVLVKEYEQMLENVMSKFRVQAHSTQEHELTLTRQYEQQRLARESTTITHELEETAKISLGLARLSEYLRLALRANGGEDAGTRPSAYTFLPVSSAPSFPLSSSFPFSDDGMVESTPDIAALERECELVRLEKENESLRALLQLRDQKDTSTLREDIVKEIKETYAQRAAGQLEGPFVGQGLSHSLTLNPGSGFGSNQGMAMGDEIRASRMFSPGAGGSRGMWRGAKRGMLGRGKSRMPAFLE